MCLEIVFITLIKIGFSVFFHLNSELVHGGPNYKVDYKSNSDKLFHSITPLHYWETVKQMSILKYLVSNNNIPSHGAQHSRSYCSSLNSCKACLKTTRDRCGWCHNYGCTNKQGLLCPKVDYQLVNQHYWKWISFCPSISHSGPILITVGDVNITVKIKVNDPVLYEKEIICVVKLKQNVVLVKGNITNGYVNCSSIRMNETNVTDQGMFSLIWGGVQPLSNEIPLEVYTCELLGTAKESCMLIPGEYNCIWCHALKRCINSEKYNRDSTSFNMMSCESKTKILHYV